MISVIIPTWNEATRLPQVLERLGRQTVPHEVIVVDGGSSDGTWEAAGVTGVQRLHSRPGRGQQLRTGAAAAIGDILFFLHADTLLPADGLSAIRATLADNPDCPGGNFRLLFDGDTGFAKWLTDFYVWLRARGFYYGDSGIFVRRAVYNALGGIRAIDLMEDYDFVRRLEKAGPTCCIGEPPLETSSRRFTGRHPVAIVYGWLEIHALFHLGVPPTYLAKRYRSQRS